MNKVNDLLEKEKVFNYPNKVSETPLVSVCVMTYQHVNFIKQCLDGILMQKTNFDYEILLGEDESTDGTRDICIEYAERYPEKIKLFLHKRENVIYINNRPTGRFNFVYNLINAKGKYIAMCEGDDYWTDPLKLQKQVDFLEARPDYSACFHPVNWLEKGKEIHIYSPVIKKDKYDEDDVFWNIPQNTICSTVFKKEVIQDKLHSFFEIPYGDMLLHITCARSGYIGFIDEPMATYRRHSGGVYSGASDKERVDNTIKGIKIIKKLFDYKNNTALNSRLAFLYEKMADIERNIINSSSSNISSKQKKGNLYKTEQLKAVNFFKKAISNFNKGNFINAEKNIKKYRKLINYNLFEQNDNRELKKPKLSVIIVAYQTNELLLSCLSSLFKNNTQDYEVIVVDNGKNELVEEALKDLSLLYIKCPYNLILSEGRNIGVHFAKGKIVAFLDDDALVPENYVSTIIEAFETYYIHGFRGKVLPKTQSKNNKVAQHYNLGDIPFPHVCDTEGNSAFLKESYLAAKGMDPLLFGGEGLDLSYRLFNKFNTGASIYWNKTIIYHDYAISDEKLKTKSARHELMNKYIRKKYDTKFQTWLSYISNFQFTENNKAIGNKLLVKKNKSGEEYTPFISICIPTYNRVNLLKRALKNALQQTYDNYEIVIIDDGSNDGTKEYLSKLNNPRINYFYVEHKGAPYARNIAVENAKGKYILWLDSDDEIDKEILKEYVKILNNQKNIDIIYSNLIRDDENKTQEFIIYQVYLDKVPLTEIIRNSPIPNLGTLIRKKLFSSVGKYNLSFKRAQDYEFWSRALSGAKIFHSPKFLATQHKHKQGHLSPSDLTSVDNSFEIRIIDNMLNMYGIEEIFPHVNWKTSNQLEKNKYYSSCYIFISEAYKKWREFKKAYEYVKKAYKLNPVLEIRKILESLEKVMKRNNIQFNSIEKTDNLEVVLIKVQQFIETKHYLSALELINETVVDFDVNNSEEKTQNIFETLLGVAGNICLSTGDLELATNYFETELKLFPNSPNACLGLGKIFYYNSELESAKTMIEWAIINSEENSKINYEAQKFLSKLNENLGYEISHNASVAELTLNDFTKQSNKLPLITICIPTYNRANYLKEAIESALNQNYENYEILIVDDGSTDNTKEIVESFNSAKIRYTKSEKNLGRPKIRNKLVSLAKGDYLLWLDDDDKLKKDLLLDYVRILQANPEVNIIYGNLLQYNDETGKEIQKYIPNDYTKSKKEMLRNLILGNGLTFPASLIKKELFEECGYFDEEFLRAQDYELWSRLYEKANFYKLDDIVCYYRKHNKNISFGNIIDHSYEAKTVKKVLKKYPLQQLFTDFDLSNNDVLDNIYYHLALSLYNFQDYVNAITLLQKIKNIINEDFLKLKFAAYINLGNEILIKKFINNIRNIPELQNYYKNFNDVFKNYKHLHTQIEKSIKYKKWSRLGTLLNRINEEVGYIAEVPYYLGVINEVEGNKETALNFYKQAIRFNPNNSEFYNAALKLSKEKEKAELKKMRERVLFEVKVFVSDENQSSKPMVTVIIPTYNRTKYLKNSIQSVLNQTYQDFEIIVINDAGEEVEPIIESLNDPRIKYINHKTNKGVAAARNTGLKNAKGKYIAYLDDDDIYYTNHLQTLVEKLESSKNKVAYSDTYFVQSSLDENGEEIIESKTLPYSFDFSKELLLLMNIAPTQCFMHAKECIDKIGYFDENFSTHEDWEYWIRLSQQYDFLHIKEVTSQVNRRTYETSFTNTNRTDFLKTMEMIYNKYKYLVKVNSDLQLAQQKRIKELKNNIRQQQSASIIIVTYNSSKTISSCIKSLKKTLREYDEVVVVDNNSQDNTTKIIEKTIKKSKRFKLIKLKENVGFSEGCNIGIRNTDNPFVVLLNPDTNVTDKWLDKMVNICTIENVAAVGPVSNYAAGYQNILAHIEEKELKSIAKNNLPYVMEKQFNKKVVETKLLIGFCMVIKRTLLEDVGLLDKELFLGNDDLDLSWRFRLKGYKLLVAVDTFVYHEGQVSFKTEKETKTNKLVQESTDKLYEKLVSHYGKGNVPTPMELWGMNWFKPTNAKFSTKAKLHSSKSTVSIVIPTYNQWEYTKQAIESIKRFTDYNYEIIIVDNASTDGTIAELKKYPEIKVIANKENFGFPKAINQGVLESKGDYILLLNNDVIVTQNWLSRMIEVADMQENIGIVGPISNSVSGVQLDKNAKYKSVKDMPKYAATIAERNKGKIVEFPRVAFLCTLIKKEVINKIGGLDEGFTPGNFEDDDFCLRAQIAGYKTVIAQDVFIHHYGSVSFKKDGNNKYAERLEINKQKFVNKWCGTPEEIWLQGKQYLSREIKYPINKDLFVQSFERALININDEEYDIAIINLKQALQYYETSERKGYENISLTDILNMAGTISLAKNQLEEAKEYFEMELKNNPNSSTACFGLGEVFYKADMLQESKTMLEWAVVNDENNQNAKLRLKEVNTKLNLPEEHNSVLLENSYTEE